MDKYEDFCVKNNLPKYRYRQILAGIYRDLLDEYTQISTLPRELAHKLELEIPINSLELVSSLSSKDGNTIKQLLKSHSGALVESVLMKHDDGRNTVCVSCMSGCPVGCKFCATGQMKFRGNLTGSEIVEQVLRYERILKPEAKRVTNVVFMGMGEPLLNVAALKDAIAELTFPEKLGLSQRRIVVSTSGYIAQLDDLINWGYKGRIAISLHAPNQKLREELMPTVAKTYPLDKLMSKLDEFVRLTNKRITYEYILISGVNDKMEHAKQLIDLLKDRLSHVNLIPCNPVPNTDYKRPSSRDVTNFCRLLNNGGVESTVRVTMGADIDSACGQLATEDIHGL